jgi:anaerobic ribonucleoside-triphosphate reductase
MTDVEGTDKQAKDLMDSLLELSHACDTKANLFFALAAQARNGDKKEFYDVVSQLFSYLGTTYYIQSAQVNVVNTINNAVLKVHDSRELDALKTELQNIRNEAVPTLNELKFRLAEQAEREKRANEMTGYG